MGTGNVLFNNKIYDYIEKTPIHHFREERELPDLIQCAIDDGKKVLYHVLDSKYVNVNTEDDITIINDIIFAESNSNNKINEVIQ
jgi:dTDP-glucose pyrophosphorylase